MDETELALQAYGRFVDLIRKEDDRVTDGLRWGYIANGALVTFVANYVLSSHRPEIGNYAEVVYSASALAISIAGWLLTMASLTQVNGARRQLIVVRDAYESDWRERIETTLRLPRPYGTRHPNEPSKLRRWWPVTVLHCIFFIWSFCFPASLLWLLYNAARTMSGWA